MKLRGCPDQLGPGRMRRHVYGSLKVRDAAETWLQSGHERARQSLFVRRPFVLASAPELMSQLLLTPGTLHPRSRQGAAVKLWDCLC